MYAQSPASPIQTWLTGWTDFLNTTLPLIFLLVVLAWGTVLVVKRNGGLPRKTIIFGLGAALVYLILPRIPDIADLIRTELPLD